MAKIRALFPLLFLAFCSTAFASSYFYVEVGPQTYNLRSTIQYTRTAPEEQEDPNNPVFSLVSRSLEYNITDYNVYTGYGAVIGFGYKFDMGAYSLGFEGNASNKVSSFDSHQVAHSITSTDTEGTVTKYPLFSTNPSVDAPFTGALYLGYKYSQRFGVSLGYGIEYTSVTVDYVFASHNPLFDGYQDVAANYLISKKVVSDDSFSKVIFSTEYAVNPQASLRLDIAWIPSQSKSFTFEPTSVESAAPNSITSDINIEVGMAKAISSVGVMYRF